MHSQSSSVLQPSLVPPATFDAVEGLEVSTLSLVLESASQPARKPGSPDPQSRIGAFGAIAAISHPPAIVIATTTPLDIVPSPIRARVARVAGGDLPLCDRLSIQIVEKRTLVPPIQTIRRVEPHSVGATICLIDSATIWLIDALRDLRLPSSFTVPSRTPPDGVDDTKHTTALVGLQLDCEATLRSLAHALRVPQTPPERYVQAGRCRRIF